MENSQLLRKNCMIKVIELCFLYCAKADNSKRDIQLQLFDVLVKPVLLYGCEVWAHEGTDILEKLHLRFCKYVLGVNKSTCTNMVYGELGATPLSLISQSRMVMFWASINK